MIFIINIVVTLAMVLYCKISALSRNLFSWLLNLILQCFFIKHWLQFLIQYTCITFAMLLYLKIAIILTLSLQWFCYINLQYFLKLYKVRSSTSLNHIINRFESQCG